MCKKLQALNKCWLFVKKTVEEHSSSDAWILFEAKTKEYNHFLQKYTELLELLAIAGSRDNDEFFKLQEGFKFNYFKEKLWRVLIVIYQERCHALTRDIDICLEQELCVAKTVGEISCNELGDFTKKLMAERTLLLLKNA